MELDFEVTINDRASGVFLGQWDTTLTLDVDANWAGIDYDVTEVWLEFDGKKVELLTSEDPFAKALGDRIVTEALASQRLQDDIFKELGGSYHGKGPNDPEGYYSYDD